MSTLAVSEVFGPTIQGEGPSLGAPAIFLRTAGCNLGCVWCDTAYTWDWKRFDRDKEVVKLDTAAVAQQIAARRPDSWASGVLVLTGGEPLLQQRALAEVLQDLHHREQEWHVEVETAGTRMPDELLPWVDQYNVSLKLEHSGNPLLKRRVPEVITAFSALERGDGADVVWKFVCAEPQDLAEVDALVRDFVLRNVWIMPEGTDHESVIAHARALLPDVLARGYRMTPRFHVDLWGHERGH